MKKPIVFFVLFVALASACSKTDDESDPAPDPQILSAIIGSWAYDTVTYDGITYSYEHTQDCTKDLFQFYNQEGKEFDFEEQYVSNCDNCAQCALTSTNLQWQLSGSTISLYFGDQFVAQLEILEVTEQIIRYKRRFDINQDGIDDDVEISGLPYDPYGNFE